MTIAVKKQLSLTLPRALRGAVADGRQIEGQAWPCHVVKVDGGIVTVAFDVGGDFTLPQVTCTLAESFYVLLPIQVGDTGVVLCASARLGGVTELGTGVAPMSLPSNLGALLFVPLARKSWTLPDANAVIVQGPNGAIVRTINGDSTVTINEDEISLNWKGKTVVINDAGITLTAPENFVDGNLTVNGDTTIIGNVQINGEVTTSGLEFAINAIAVTITAAVEINGSLSINGKPFDGHEHSAGTYHAGGTQITNTSGGVVP